MIATKTMIPRAVVSLLLIAALVLVFGRAFCSWLCPTMLIDRIRDFFRSPKKRRELEEKKNSEIKAISQQELASLKAAREGHTCGACGKCQPVHHGKVDSRHAVLGGALLSTAVCSAWCARWACRSLRCSSSGAPSPMATRRSGLSLFRRCLLSSWWCCASGARISARFRRS